MCATVRVHAVRTGGDGALAVRRIPAEASSSGSIPQLTDRLFGNFLIRKTYQLISSLTHTLANIFLLGIGFYTIKNSTTFLLSLNSTNKYGSNSMHVIDRTVSMSLDSRLIKHVIC